MSYKQNVGFCRVLYYRPALFIAFYKMDTFVKHNFGLMICNFFNKVRFLTNKLKLLIFMKKPFLHLHLSLLFLMGCVFLLPSCIASACIALLLRLSISPERRINSTRFRTDILIFCFSVCSCNFFPLFLYDSYIILVDDTAHCLRSL